MTTVTSSVLEEMLSTTGKWAHEFGIRVSNPTVGDGCGSYRVWGDHKLHDFDMLMTALGVKQVQKFRWYETRHGKGKICAGDAEYHRNLGFGEYVSLRLEITHSGSILLKFQLVERSS